MQTKSVVTIIGRLAIILLFSSNVLYAEVSKNTMSEIRYHSHEENRVLQDAGGDHFLLSTSTIFFHSNFPSNPIAIGIDGTLYIRPEWHRISDDQSVFALPESLREVMNAQHSESQVPPMTSYLSIKNPDYSPATFRLLIEALKHELEQCEPINDTGTYSTFEMIHLKIDETRYRLTRESRPAEDNTPSEMFVVWRESSTKHGKAEYFGGDEHAKKMFHLAKDYLLNYYEEEIASGIQQDEEI